MKKHNRTDDHKNKYRLICLLTCLSFISAVISFAVFAYNKGTYRVYADSADDEEEMMILGTHATNEERDYFFSVMVPLVVNDMAENRILASLTLSQAAMETGWGISRLARECKNMFGIRAYGGWPGRVFNSTTKQIYENYAEGSKHSGKLWRVYDSWADSVKDHSTLFNTVDIYKNIRGNWDYKFCARELVRAGYTDNPEYAETLIYVIEHYGFTQYDEQAFAIMNGSAPPISLPTEQTTSASAGTVTTTEAVATETTKQVTDYIPKDKQDFINTVDRLAAEDMKTSRILASFTVAQAIFHSDWGKSTTTVKSYNLFGIKAISSWSGKVYNSSTGKVYSTYAEAAKSSGSLWRAYDSLDESVADRSAMFIKSSRYQNLIGNYDYKSCCRLVVEDGYTSSSTYASTLISYIEEYGLTRFDTQQDPVTTAPGPVVTKAPETTAPAENSSLMLKKYDTKGNGTLLGFGTKMTVDGFLSVLGISGGDLRFSGIKGKYIGTGTKVTDGTGKTYVFVIEADIDGDGEVTASDYILIKKCCLGLNALSGVFRSAADLDSNGKIDSTDYINVKRIILGIK